jgi:cyclic lactone autoinducer peptide
MKKYVFNIFVAIASVVAFAGIHPTSWSSLYQPQIPEELIR